MTSTPLVRLASIGDFCVDDYVDDGRSYLGGTAYNVAVQARQGGAQASVLSAIGSDAFGDRFLAALDKHGIHTERLQRRSGKTSRVIVRLDAEKTPTFEEWELEVLRDFALTAEDHAFLKTHHAARSIMLKGLEHPFEQFCAFEMPDTLKVADFAGGSEYSVPFDAILEYIEQLDVVIRSVENGDELEALRGLSQDHQCLMIGTMGSGGSVVFQNGAQYQEAADAVEAVDTTGAGDAYIAHFIVNYVRTKDIVESMRQATQAAAEAVQDMGATSEEIGEGGE